MAKKEIKEVKEGFTGNAITFECEFDQGFSTYRIVILKVENGQVVGFERSQHLMSFEALGRFSAASETAMFDLMDNYKTGTNADWLSKSAKEILLLAKSKAAS